jgi:hypothetical protein
MLPAAPSAFHSTLANLLRLPCRSCRVQTVMSKLPSSTAKIVCISLVSCSYRLATLSRNNFQQQLRATTYHQIPKKSAFVTKSRNSNYVRPRSNLLLGLRPLLIDPSLHNRRESRTLEITSAYSTKPGVVRYMISNCSRDCLYGCPLKRRNVSRMLCQVHRHPQSR